MEAAGGKDVFLDSLPHPEAFWEPYELNGLTGDLARSELGTIHSQTIRLVDKSGHVMHITVISQVARLPDVEQVLGSLEYYDLGANELTADDSLSQTVDLVPDGLSLRVPAGWWAVSPGEGIGWTTPVMYSEFFTEWTSTGDPSWYEDKQVLTIAGLRVGSQ